jgi:predicted MFS family arabinose efflux permease
VLGRVIGSIVGFRDTGTTLELASFLHTTSIPRLLPLFTPAARPAALQGREERMGALRHRCAVMPMMPMMMMDHAGLA